MEFLKEGVAQAGSWSFPYLEGERLLWGPVVYDMESLGCFCCPRKRRLLRWPSGVLLITTHRLIVTQITTKQCASDRCNMMCMACECCRRGYISAIAFLPLSQVQGFSIEEAFRQQQGKALKKLRRTVCGPASVSGLTIRVLANLGMGKCYPPHLTVKQRTIGIGEQMEKMCFEESRVLEARKWLGNLSSFFMNSETAGLKNNRKSPIDLEPSRFGWSPI